MSKNNWFFVKDNSSARASVCFTQFGGSFYSLNSDKFCDLVFFFFCFVFCFCLVLFSFFFLFLGGGGQISWVYGESHCLLSLTHAPQPWRMHYRLTQAQMFCFVRCLFDRFHSKLKSLQRLEDSDPFTRSHVSLCCVLFRYGKTIDKTDHR